MLQPPSRPRRMHQWSALSLSAHSNADAPHVWLPHWPSKKCCPAVIRPPPNDDKKPRYLPLPRHMRAPASRYLMWLMSSAVNYPIRTHRLPNAIQPCLQSPR
ncbi:hypothetical protein LX32DRAFT_433971 [Colletotrichum zoysiae]|uniref:Uncharacterized protein n=1 Tax=Colletotrichum zoysiae TaxID=1216348 RepID=A0AAD9HEL8_9PEZI|nr:hypothetical protein LX32DRAFT_433971 [Colletotrichum zoysiae]